jgi:hypothetical protein
MPGDIIEFEQKAGFRILIEGGTSSRLTRSSSTSKELSSICASADDRRNG